MAIGDIPISFSTSPWSKNSDNIWLYIRNVQLEFDFNSGIKETCSRDQIVFPIFNTIIDITSRHHQGQECESIFFLAFLKFSKHLEIIFSGLKIF
jgi:hypothetical protein